ncbi:MAG: 3-deoxy-manno-octulosonate cytidylyltransferase [Deltaproteobacteria bacterium]|nr:3-deoxy-manno-octulosonate cytidylyltransferase [Deltaproteobacteria bacterium]
MSVDRPRIVAVIPARYDSTRLPGKALAVIGGAPMIQHVYERTRHARWVDRTLVATDDARIAAAVRAFGGEVVTTGAQATGTDRVAAVAADLAADVILDVQGDLPCIDPDALAACVAPFADPTVVMTSLMTPLRDEAEWRNPHVVKVVTDADGFALYFSRSPLPYWRGARDGAPFGYRHLGLYAWRRATLLALAAAPRSALERAEELEQLRALERGVRIKMVLVDSAGPEVDTAEDLERVRHLVEGDG